MSDPIRILHVIGIMNRGGAENMIMNLYRNIDRSKVQFDFVENSLEHAAFDDEIKSMGGRIYNCPHYNGKNHFSYVRWWKDFFSHHSDEYHIIHGHLGSTAAIYLSIAKKHGLYTIAHSHSAGRSSILFSLFSYPTRFVADHFFACSHEAGTSRYGTSVGNNTLICQTLKNAIDTQKFIFNPAVRTEMRNRLNIPPSTFVIGHTGRFVDAKNHSFLIDIFSAIHKRIPNSVLLLVGDGILRPQIEQKIQQLGLMDSVILAGVQSNVYDYYQSMDAFVMPSIYEGLPVTLVEAQTSSLSCFISNTIPAEAAITDLVHFRSLTDAPSAWADWICDFSYPSRKDMKNTMEAKGYDISSTSIWLQNFYENVMKTHGQ